MLNTASDLEALRSLIGADDVVVGDEGVTLAPTFEGVVLSGGELKAKAGEIWSPEEIAVDPLAGEDCADERAEPKYQISLMQSLTAEDTYMGLSGKDPSSNSCDQLVVTIDLPGVDYAKIDLDVRFNRILVRCPTHKLFLHLPHPVDDTKGKAMWKAPTLKLKLPIVRSDIM